MTGENFTGKAIPCGVKVFFTPTDTREKTYAGKFDPKGISSIFAGYVITTGQQRSRKYKVWDMAEFANVNLSISDAVLRKLAQPYLTEVVVLPDELVFPLKDEYERMNSTLEGLNDNVRLQGKEIKDKDVVDRPPDGGNDDDDDDGDDDESKGKPPPGPGEIDEGHGIGEDPLDYYGAIDAIGEKMLVRAEEDAKAHGETSSSTPLPKTGGPRSHDEVGPPGRLIPKGGEEDPGEILHRLKQSKLVSDDVEHWSTGIKGDGKSYLNDDGGACKIDKRGVPYKIGSDGSRSVPTPQAKASIRTRRMGHVGCQSQGESVQERQTREEQKKQRRTGREPLWARSWWFTNSWTR